VSRKRFNPAEIERILREYQSGVKVPVLCRRHGVSEQTFYLWLVRWRRLEAAPTAG
jgi:putative transposase